MGTSRPFRPLETGPNDAGAERSWRQQPRNWGTDQHRSGTFDVENDAFAVNDVAVDVGHEDFEQVV